MHVSKAKAKILGVSLAKNTLSKASEFFAASRVELRVSELPTSVYGFTEIKIGPTFVWGGLGDLNWQLWHFCHDNHRVRAH